MQVKSTYADIWRISWPIMLSSVANTVINITDVAFVARVGETQLAASALAGVFYFVMVMIGVAIGIGSQIMMSRKAGENDPAGLGKIFDHSLLLLITLGFLLMGVVYFAIPSFMHIVVQSQPIADAAVQYLQARAWALPFMMMLVSLRCFYTSITLTRIITYTTVLMMVLNVILGYLLVFGNFGFPKMGIAGAGLASAISEVAAAVYALLYTFIHSSFKKFNLFKLRNIQMEIGAEIMQLSSPIVLQHFLSMGAWFLFFLFIEKSGEHALAISNVVRSVYMILMTPIWGYSQACNSMVSNLIGQQKSNEVLTFTGKIVKLSMITSLIVVVFTVLFSPLIFSVVTADQQLVQDSMGSFYVIACATIFFSVSMILLSALSGTGKTNIAMLIEITNIFAYLLFVVVCTEVLHTSVEVVWCSEIQYWFLMGLFSWLYLRSNKWKEENLKMVNT